MRKRSAHDESENTTTSDVEESSDRMIQADSEIQQGEEISMDSDGIEDTENTEANYYQPRSFLSTQEPTQAVNIKPQAKQAAVEGNIPEDILQILKHTPIMEVVKISEYQSWISNEFRKILTTSVDSRGYSIYHEEIKIMCMENKESFELDYRILEKQSPVLVRLLINATDAVLSLFNKEMVRVVRMFFEDYERVKESVYIRIKNMPVVENLSELRHTHLNTLVQVRGVVTRRSVVFPQLRLVKYNCGKCGRLVGPIRQEAGEETKPQRCSECGSRGPFTANLAQTVYQNYQSIRLQESPGKVPAGRLPRSKEVILVRDLVDTVRPGEEIEVIGVYRNNYSRHLNAQNGFPVFSTVIEANNIVKGEDYLSSFGLTKDDEQRIKELSQDPHIVERLVESIAPSIGGLRDIKTAVCLSLFGGQEKNIQGKHRVRGDINVLLLGDPGTAKSQILRYVSKTSYRAVLANGQGASAVGLTASVRKDPITREWTLEGGALVLADKGVCLIDEFDKMNDVDRTSIHEAMEQQSISVSKAGIVASLQARCAVIAAANPIRGRYNQSLVFSQNVNLTEPILSRFDVLCVVKDRIDPTDDAKTARFIVGSHIRSHPSYSPEVDRVDAQKADVQEIDQELLRKYIVYARQKKHPVVSQMDIEKISKLYAELRKESMSSGGIPITVRHLESIVRISEAHARMCLRESVRSDDLDFAVKIALESFIGSQRFSVMREMRKRFSRYLRCRNDSSELLYFCLQELVQDEIRYLKCKNKTEDIPEKISIGMSLFEEKARELNIEDLRLFYTTKLFQEKGFRINSEKKTIEKFLQAKHFG